MDGFDATKRIIAYRKANKLAPIPVVALTAKVMPVDRDACLSVGMSDYISKPITRQKLIDVLKKLFPDRIKISAHDNKAPSNSE